LLGTERKKHPMTFVHREERVRHDIAKMSFLDNFTKNFHLIKKYFKNFFLAWSLNLGSKMDRFLKIYFSIIYSAHL
jgi:hypothetical protein